MYGGAITKDKKLIFKIFDKNEDSNEYLKKNDYNYIEKFVHIDQSLLNNFDDYEKEYNQHKQIIHSNDYLFSNNKYIHPELEYSIVLKQNSNLYHLVENILNHKQHKNGSTSNNHRLKRKYSTHYSQNQIILPNLFL